MANAEWRKALFNRVISIPFSPFSIPNNRPIPNSQFPIPPAPIRNSQFAIPHSLLLPFLFLFLCFPFLLPAQEADRFPALSRQLDSLARFVPGLNNRADLALSNVPLHDYVRSLGKVHKINLYIDDTPGKIVTNNFTDESVKSIFLFVCKKFDYDIEPTGTILNFVPYVPRTAPPPPRQPKLIQIAMEDSLIWFDLKNDTLDAVVRKVSRLTGRTLIVGKEHAGDLLSGYVPPTSFDTALENIMFMNGFNVVRHRKGFYLIDKIGAAGVAASGGKGARPAPGGEARQPTLLNDFTLDVGRDTSGQDLLFLRAENAPIDGILRDIFEALGLEFYMFDQIEGNTTLNVEGETLDDVLKNMLRGTEFTWRNDGDVYLIGKRDMEGLRQVKIINLKYRPTAKVIELIPTKFKENVELKEFVELNRIIVSGSAERIKEIEDFILEIDRPVPMVKIEMVVVDVDFTKILKTGVKAGLFQPGDSASAIKSLFPGVDWTLDGSAINGLLTASGIPAIMNVGTLKSNFYLQLQAQETRGNLRVVTRPVISTLNGNEASITIGQTDYYLLQSEIFNTSSVNNVNTVSQRYEKIEINTTITVKPIVSQDGMVTLDLNPNFTVPGTRVASNVPPSILTRQFESTIRVKDGETVVLGGLSRESNSNNNEGLPVISRIPVLKWFFGNQNNNKSRSSLIIYITPTIYYN
jgi:type IV pilus assembly protein PilQ